MYYSRVGFGVYGETPQPTLLSYVKALEGTDKQRRKATIIKTLQWLGAKPQLHTYATGQNIIATLPGSSQKQILVVAHYDNWPRSPAANDDCSAIAVIFDLIRRLKRVPRKHTLKFIIFDEEEFGCKGSWAYVEDFGTDNILSVYDMQLVGMGDTFGLWPAIPRILGSRPYQVLARAINKLGYHYENAGILPDLDGDYDPFLKSGVDAFCISVVPGEQRDAIRRYAESSVLGRGIKYGSGLVQTPKLFKLWHTPDDTHHHLNEGAMRMTADVLHHSIVLP